MNPLYRNVGYSPRIWGVSYIYLFTTLFGFVFLLLILKSLGLMRGFIISVLACLSLYSYFYWLSNRDQVEYEARRKRKYRKHLVCYQRSKGIRVRP